MLELGHTQVSDCDEVLDVSESSGGPLGLLEQAVHRFDIGVAAPVEHAAHHTAEVHFQGARQTLEGLQARAPCPIHPLVQRCQGDVLAIAGERSIKR